MKTFPSNNERMIFKYLLLTLISLTIGVFAGIGASNQYASLSSKTTQDWSNIATIIGILLIIAQITFAIYSYYVENKRTKKKATLDYYESINQQLKNEKRKLTYKFGAHHSDYDIKHFERYKEDRVRFHRVLNLYDRLAIGVNENIYDIGLLNRLNGHLIMSNYERYKEYIEGYSKREKREAWAEFTILYNRLKKYNNDKANN